MEHRLVIIGGGFGGLYAAQSLKNAALEVTLIDRRNFHLFQPLLYQVATGWLSPANIASTLRATLGRQKNARIFLAEADDIDVERRRVLLNDGPIEYDSLVVATGSWHHYFGHDHWQTLAPGLKKTPRKSGVGSLSHSKPPNEKPTVPNLKHGSPSSSSVAAP